MNSDRMPEQPQVDDLSIDSDQPDGPTVHKKPFVEPTLGQAVSLPEVTGAFLGTVSF